MGLQRRRQVHLVVNQHEDRGPREKVAELLEHGHQLRAIRHNGADLGQADFDRVVKIAASKMASDRICQALGIKTDEEHFRFGFSS